jgi:D-alanyl-D-alanine carboxypeptidase/D-alanyl-D-alanine-endopeptidase (penicillin-binding protein 4)
MKRILAGIFLTSFSTFALSSPLQIAADKIINQVDPATNIGVSVLDLTTGEVLYQRNAQRSFIPASNMKLFSDAAALMALGPDYRFQTKLSTNASSIENGTLNGSIFIHLPGDPSLTRHDLADLLRELQILGIKRIHGNVILVSNNSAVSAYAPGWVEKDYKYSYGAPLAPVVLDENRLWVTVNPANKVGAPAVVEYGEQNGIVLHNQVKTVASEKGCGVGVNLDAENQLTTTGCVGAGQWAVQQRVPIINPLRYMQAIVRGELANLNIAVDGQIQLGNTTKNTLLIASHSSKPIAQLLADTLKPSDNLYADSLFLHAATKINGSPLNWAQAQQVVKNFLQQQTGVNLQTAVLTDGSGLSRQDLLSPQQTVGLLQFLHQKFPLSYEYIAALPIAGQDGTLQRRLRLPSQKGLVRAKTGTMSGIVGLSGYLYTANSHTLAFAIFVNRTPQTPSNVAGRYRSLVDTLCAFFLRQKPSNMIYAGKTYLNKLLAYQQKPNQLELQRGKNAKWRHLEIAIKNATKGLPVTVIYRGNTLLIQDHNLNSNAVWSALQKLRNRNIFAVSLTDRLQPPSGSQNQLLWIKTSEPLRTWTIKEAV